MTTPKITLRASLALVPDERRQVSDILGAFTTACRILRGLSEKHHTSHQVALHALAYKALTSLKPEDRHPLLSLPLPSQYAHRAIQRIAHQARASRAGQPDPYPPHSFDLDARCADLRLADSTLAITRLSSRGLVGGANRDLRMPLSLQFPSKPDRLAAASARILGATISLPQHSDPYVILRLQPKKGLVDGP